MVLRARIFILVKLLTNGISLAPNKKDQISASGPKMKKILRQLHFLQLSNCRNQGCLTISNYSTGAEIWPNLGNQSNSTWCQKKRGISECHSVSFTVHLIQNLKYSFLIHLKMEIHMFVPRTKPFLSNIRERKNIYRICAFITFNFTVGSVKLSTAHILIVC